MPHMEDLYITAERVDMRSVLMSLTLPALISLTFFDEDFQQPWPVEESLLPFKECTYAVDMC
jgi:hypothetical protein